MRCIKEFIDKCIKLFKSNKKKEDSHEENYITARQLMYSGSQLFVLFSHFNEEEIINTFISSKQDVLPVCGNSIDDVKGCYSIHKLVNQLKNKKKIDILDSIPIKFISPNSEMMYVLSLMYNNPESILIVTNEFGGTEGIITKQSIIYNIYDNYAHNLIIDSRNNQTGAMILDGNTQIWKLKPILNINLEDYECETVGGFVLEYFKNIPNTNDWFEFHNYIIRVVEVKNNRITKVELTPVSNLAKINN